MQCFPSWVGLWVHASHISCQKYFIFALKSVTAAVTISISSIFKINYPKKNSQTNKQTHKHTWERSEKWKWNAADMSNMVTKLKKQTITCYTIFLSMHNIVLTEIAIDFNSKANIQISCWRRNRVMIVGFCLGLWVLLVRRYEWVCVCVCKKMKEKTVKIRFINPLI